MKMRHVDTIVLVKNIEKSKAFYTDILKLDIIHDWKSMVIFSNRLALHQADLLHPQEIRSYIQSDAFGAGNLLIYLETANIEIAFDRLKKKNIELLHGIVKLPWGGKIFRIKDPDGHIIEIGELHE